jgi:dynactin 1
MGHGMFVRPNTLKLLAGPPAPFLPQANKKARPSSTLSTASSKGPAPPDPSLTRRISVNAPSPTPNTRPTRLNNPRVSANRLVVLSDASSAPPDASSCVSNAFMNKLIRHCSYRPDPPLSKWESLLRMLK